MVTRGRCIAVRFGANFGRRCCVRDLQRIAHRHHLFATELRHGNFSLAHLAMQHTHYAERNTSPTTRAHPIQRRTPGDSPGNPTLPHGADCDGTDFTDSVQNGIDYVHPYIMLMQLG